MNTAKRESDGMTLSAAAPASLFLLVANVMLLGYLRDHHAFAPLLALAAGGTVAARFGGAHRQRALAVVVLAVFVGYGAVVWQTHDLFPIRHVLTVTATTERQPASSASEAWVKALLDEHGAFVPRSELALSGDWRLHDAHWLSRGEESATLHWEGVLRGTPRLRFRSNPRSGVVEIRWDDRVQRVDLYSPKHSGVEHDVPLPTTPRTRLRLCAEQLAVLLLLAAQLCVSMSLVRRFALPRLQSGRGAVVEGLIVGLLIQLPYTPVFGAENVSLTRQLIALAGAALLVGLGVVVLRAWWSVLRQKETLVARTKLLERWLTPASLGLFVLVILATRLPFFIEYPMVGFAGDTRTYYMVEQAWQGGYWPTFAIRSPGYPLLAALTGAIWSSNLFVVMLQSLLSLGAGLTLIYAFGRLNRWLAPIASVLYSTLAVTDLMMVYETSLLTDGPFTSLVALTFGLLMLGLITGRARVFLSMSLALAAALYVRPAGAFMIPVALLVGVYLLLRRRGVRAAAAATAPWILGVLALCAYNKATIGRFSPSLWGSANWAAATSTFWTTDDSFPPELREQVQAFTQTIAAEDARTLERDWNPRRLWSVYERYFNASFWRSPGMNGYMQEVDGVALMPDSLGGDLRDSDRRYVRHEPLFARLARHSIAAHPMMYAKFVWTNAVIGTTFSQAHSGDARFFEFLGRRFALVYGPHAKHGGDNAAYLREYAARPSFLRRFEIDERGEVALTPSWGMRAHQAVHRVLNSRFLPPFLPRLALALLPLSLLALWRRRDEAAMAAFCAALFYVGAVLLVALVEVAEPRYSLPVYFVIYLSPILAGVAVVRMRRPTTSANAPAASPNSPAETQPATTGDEAR